MKKVRIKLGKLRSYHSIYLEELVYVKIVRSLDWGRAVSRAFVLPIPNTLFLFNKIYELNDANSKN